MTLTERLWAAIFFVFLLGVMFPWAGQGAP